MIKTPAQRDAKSFQVSELKALLARVPSQCQGTDASVSGGSSRVLSFVSLTINCRNKYSVFPSSVSHASKHSTWPGGSGDRDSRLPSQSAGGPGRGQCPRWSRGRGQRGNCTSTPSCAAWPGSGMPGRALGGCAGLLQVYMPQLASTHGPFGHSCPVTSVTTGQRHPGVQVTRQLRVSGGESPEVPVQSWANSPRFGQPGQASQRKGQQS